ncbi:RBBP9/YdeN family alpha/beta hydrolase [Rhizorhabdus wittichii]|uniref:RBBP9/YdeN family alpha/beta hydrolase n=1 Tax=Rhizorhabdus wittichii TaxID=160791 RepID=UPI0002EBC519|nr:alpha/beta hydrolase [Rhizorhabdus wittichii]
MAHEGPLCLIVPGLDNSGPDHWQTLWEEKRDDCRRVDLGCWSEPDRRIWTERLDAALAMTDGPLVLVAHSLGCLTIAWWALGAPHERLARVRGALLVAPPDVDAADAHPLVRRFAPAPAAALPFPSILVASRDDRYAAFDRLETLARAWGSRFVDAGHAGHINARVGARRLAGRRGAAGGTDRGECAVSDQSSGAPAERACKVGFHLFSLCSIVEDGESNGQRSEL